MEQPKVWEGNTVCHFERNLRDRTSEVVNEMLFLRCFLVAIRGREPLVCWLPTSARLQEHGIAIESRVRWELGGESLYFRDPDQNVVELATPGIWPIY